MKQRRHPDRPLSQHSPAVAEQWHPWLNGDVTPEWVAVASGQAVWWRCDRGHVWSARVFSRTRDAKPAGCRTCNDLSGGTLAERRPDLAAELHPTRNYGLTADLVASRSSKKVVWLCSHGHEWVTTPKARSYGSGCPTCDDLAGGTVTERRPDLVTEWDPDNVDRPDQVAAGSDRRIGWVCRTCGRRWVTSVKHRTVAGSGCPTCADGRRGTSRSAAWSLNGR